MSIQVLLEDQIKRLFAEYPEFNLVDKNQFEIAVASFANFKYLNGIDSDDLIEGIMGNGGDEGIDLCYLFCDGILIKDENHQIKADSTVKVKFFQVKKETGFSIEGFRNLKEGVLV